MTTIAGVILAGGRSRRMGVDKAHVHLAGKSLLVRAIDRLLPQVDMMAVSSNDELVVSGHPVLPDGALLHQGPLAGVAAGLNWASRQGATHLVIAAVDTPFFPVDLVARLADGEGLAVARSSRIHPVFSLWPIGLSPDLHRHIAASDNRSLMAFFELHHPRLVDFDAVPRDPFFNINTPEDLVEAERIALEHDT